MCDSEKHEMRSMLSQCFPSQFCKPLETWYGGLFLLFEIKTGLSLGRCGALAASITAELVFGLARGMLCGSNNHSRLGPVRKHVAHQQGKRRGRDWNPHALLLIMLEPGFFLAFGPLSY